MSSEKKVFFGGITPNAAIVVGVGSVISGVVFAVNAVSDRFDEFVNDVGSGSVYCAEEAKQSGQSPYNTTFQTTNGQEISCTVTSKDGDDLPRITLEML